jgi:hypothetical protein
MGTIWTRRAASAGQNAALHDLEDGVSVSKSMIRGSKAAISAWEGALLMLRTAILIMGNASTWWGGAIPLRVNASSREAGAPDHRSDATDHMGGRGLLVG